MSREQLVNRHILEYESRMKHIAELYARAQKATAHLPGEHRSKSELQALAEQKAQLENKADEIRSTPASNWRKQIIKSAGPMAIWDILAEQLEDFVERHE